MIHLPQVEGSLCLTPGLSSALCPRFSPAGDTLLFLSHEAAAASGVHSATAALHTLSWPPPGEAPTPRELAFALTLEKFFQG